MYLLNKKDTFENLENESIIVDHTQSSFAFLCQNFSGRSFFGPAPLSFLCILRGSGKVPPPEKIPKFEIDSQMYTTEQIHE